VWSAASRTTDVYLGSRSVAFVDAQGAPRWHETQGVLQGLELLEAAVREKLVRPRCRLWLSGALARPFMLEPVTGLRNRVEVHQAAEGVAPEATGLEGPCEVWIEDAFPRRKAIAVAIERSTLELIDTAVRRKSGLRVVSIKPWWQLGLNRLLGDETGRNARVLLVEEPEALTLVAGEAGVFQEAATCWPVPEVGQARAWVRRNLLDLRFQPSDAWRLIVSRWEVAPADGPVAVAVEPLT
jgi:hypothetical protein